MNDVAGNETRGFELHADTARDRFDLQADGAHSPVAALFE